MSERFLADCPAVGILKTEKEMHIECTIVESDITFKLKVIASVEHGISDFEIRHCSDRYSVIRTRLWLTGISSSIFNNLQMDVTKDYKPIPYPPLMLTQIPLKDFDTCRLRITVDSLSEPTVIKKVADGTGDLSQFITKMLREATLSDCVLKVGDKEIKAHRCFLAQNSAVFHAMFSHTSTDESKNGVVQIRDSDFVSVNSMLEFMYTGSVELNKENVEGLLALADKYNVEGLMRHCIEYKITIIDGTNVIRSAVMGDRYRSSKIIEKCMEYLKNNRAAVLGSDEWKELKKTNKDLAIRLLEY